MLLLGKVGVVVVTKVCGFAKFELDFQTLLVLGPLQKLLLPLTLHSNNIPAKNSKSCSFSTLLNHQNMILDVSENSWIGMSTTLIKTHIGLLYLSGSTYSNPRASGIGSAGGADYLYPQYLANKSTLLFALQILKTFLRH